MNIAVIHELTVERQTQVRELAERLIDEKLFANTSDWKTSSIDWTFKFNTLKTSYGLCRWSNNSIEISTVLNAGRTLEAIEQTILHEIAHANTGPGHGHGRLWKNNARAIGVVKPSARTKFVGDTSKREFPWYVVTSTGEVFSGRHKKPSLKAQHSMKSKYVPGRKAETLGKLFYIDRGAYIQLFNMIPEVD